MLPAERPETPASDTKAGLRRVDRAMLRETTAGAPGASSGVHLAVPPSSYTLDLLLRSKVTQGRAAGFCSAGYTRFSTQPGVELNFHQPRKWRDPAIWGKWSKSPKSFLGGSGGAVVGLQRGGSGGERRPTQRALSGKPLQRSKRQPESATYLGKPVERSGPMGRGRSIVSTS